MDLSTLNVKHLGLKVAVIADSNGYTGTGRITHITHSLGDHGEADTTITIETLGGDLEIDRDSIGDYQIEFVD